MTRFGALAAPVLAGIALVSGAATAATEAFVYLEPEAIEYQSAPGSGMKQALLAGDPSKPGLYVLRVVFPPGVTSPPHYHDQDRFVTVISGIWHFGMGASGDCTDTVPLPAGSFAIHPKGAAHFDGSCTSEPVEVEIRGMGPVITERVAPGPSP